MASLIEASSTGFRASHDSNAMAPGLEVEFESSWRSGRARVIWSRMHDGSWISGFLML